VTRNSDFVVFGVFVVFSVLVASLDLGSTACGTSLSGTEVLVSDSMGKDGSAVA